MFAPCGGASVIDAAPAGSLPCRILAGAANDTRATAAVDRLLHERQITYVADFVANAGGVI